MIKPSAFVNRMAFISFRQSRPRSEAAFLLWMAAEKSLFKRHWIAGLFLPK